MLVTGVQPRNLVIYLCIHTHTHTLGFSGGSDSKKLVQEPWVHSLGWADPLEKGMATHSRILAWSVPWTEEPGKLVHGVEKSDMTERLTLPLFIYIY